MYNIINIFHRVQIYWTETKIKTYFSILLRFTHFNSLIRNFTTYRFAVTPPTINNKKRYFSRDGINPDTEDSRTSRLWWQNDIQRKISLNRLNCSSPLVRSICLMRNHDTI